MREIKFRGKTIKGVFWVYGSLIHDTENESFDIEWFDFQGQHSFEVDPITVGEFTGLHDKNGNEIYEGDIVADENGDSEDNFYVCEFVTNEARFIFCSPLDGEVLEENDIACDLVVIGNIHENPELL